MTDTTNTKGNTEQKERMNQNKLMDTIDLRDYFAAKAMAATIASYTTASYTTASYEEIALWAYQQADAMLDARGEV